MLDTNMVSFIIKRRSLAAGARLLALRTDEIAYISTITEAELMFGLYKSGNKEPARKLLELSLARLTIYSWDSRAAALYGFIRARQEAQGYPLQALDMQIAAHALAMGATLITHDKAFRHVHGLSTEDWATDR